MLRRTWLKVTGLSVGFSSYGACRVEAAPRVQSDQQRETPSRAQVVLTAADDPWTGEVAGRLKDRWRVAGILWEPLRAKMGSSSQDFPAVRVDPDRREDLQKALSGAEVVVHVIPERQDQLWEDRVEEASRLTYQLLQAALDGGVRAVVLVSSLKMMEVYEQDFLVDEEWQPAARGPEFALPEYLAEFVCREFAREKLLKILVMRLGRIMDGFPPLDEARRLAWVVREDALKALESAVELLLGPRRENLPWWNCVHIAGASPPGRFPVRRAERLLGYRPSPYPR
jgi:nucleoside-diphosphate-sugar epimerase